MSKTILIFTLTASFLLSSCGGARSTAGSSIDSFANVTSNSSLSWQAPTEYTDATPISVSEIGGYRVYAGTNRQNLRLVANIPSSTVNTFSLAAFGKGPLYVTVTCYDITGIESSFSDILALNII